MRAGSVESKDKSVELDFDNEDFEIVEGGAQLPSETYSSSSSVPSAVQSAAVVASAATMVLASKPIFIATGVSLGVAFACDKFRGDSNYKNTKMVAGALGLAAATTSNLGGFINNQTANAVVNPYSQQSVASKLMFYGGLVAPLVAPFFPSAGAYRAATVVASTVMAVASKSNDVTITEHVGNMLEQAGSNVATNIANTTRIPAAVVTCAHEASAAIESCSSKMPKMPRMLVPGLVVSI